MTSAIRKATVVERCPLFLTVLLFHYPERGTTFPYFILFLWE